MSMLTENESDHSGGTPALREKIAKRANLEPANSDAASMKMDPPALIMAPVPPVWFSAQTLSLKYLGSI